jgi:lipopolysaccharide/colanic/teichoic acid biosynthesis glycosyltransferase
VADLLVVSMVETLAFIYYSMVVFVVKLLVLLVVVSGSHYDPVILKQNRHGNYGGDFIGS